MNEKEILDEIFDSVRPYINNPSDLREAVKGVSEKSSNLDEFIEEFENLTAEKEDPSTKTDFRIFLNKLKSR